MPPRPKDGGEQPAAAIGVASQGPARPQAFLFADLAGFTALTEAHGADRAADLARRFANDVGLLLAEHGATEVKRLGDGLMLRADNAASALRLGLRIARGVGARHGFPLVRVGIHTGAATEREGDWYGPAVNVAARVAALAGGGEVVVSDAIGEAASRLDDIELDERGEVRLKNVAEPVRLFRARRTDEPIGPRLAIDPVCRMAVEASGQVAQIAHQGTEHSFCSLECARAFANDPDGYLSLLSDSALEPDAAAAGPVRPQPGRLAGAVA